MFAVSFVVLATAVAVAADESEKGWYRHEYKDFSISMGMGTPMQGPFKFLFNPLMDKLGYLQPAISSKDAGGLFNANASKSFVFLRNSPNPAGSFDGTDTIQITNGVQIPKSEIQVKYKDLNQHGFVDLTPGINGKLSFVDEWLKALGGSKTIVQHVVVSETGALTLGDPNPKGCSTEWEVFPSKSESYIQMTMQIDEIEIGKYHQTEKIRLAFEDNWLFFDAQTDKTVRKQLEVEETDELSCDQKKEIIIRAGRYEFTLGPEDYIRWWRTRDGDRCQYTPLKSAANVLRLPVQFLKGHCLRYDFEATTMSLSKIV